MLIIIAVYRSSWAKIYRNTPKNYITITVVIVVVVDVVVAIVKYSNILRHYLTRAVCCSHSVTMIIRAVQIND